MIFLNTEDIFYARGQARESIPQTILMDNDKENISLKPMQIGAGPAPDCVRITAVYFGR